MRQADIESIYPLSPVQQGILFHSSLGTAANVYIETVHFRMRGVLDVALFKDAWQQLIARHAVLRTLFVWKNRKMPLQVVRRQADVPWQEYDWRHLSSHEQQAKLNALLQHDRAQGFDLSRAPLLRLTLVRQSSNVYHMIWTHHHIVLDGWSVALLLKEAFAMYRANLRGEPTVFEPPRPFKEYIAWLQEQDSSHAEPYWRTLLHGFTSPTSLGGDALSADRGRPAVQYREQLRRLPPPTTSALHMLAQRNQLTLNTVVQGAWALLLSRYSGSMDVVFGSAVSGRSVNCRGIESMVGLFINTLPVRVALNPNVSLLPWLRDLQAQQIRTRQWEHSSLKDVQAWSDVERTYGQPLFDTILSFNNYSLDGFLEQAAELQIDGLTSLEGSHYPISVLVDPGEALTLRVNYDCERFDDLWIGRILAHFQTLLESIAADPHRPLAAYSLLTEAESRQLLVDFNRTARALPPERTVVQLFEAQAARTPDATALRLGQETLTYAELNRRANQLARYLMAQGVGPETIVALCLDRSPEAVIAIWGVLKAGGGYLPLDAALPKQRLTLMLEETAAPVILTTTELAGRLPATSAAVVRLNADWPTVAAQTAENPLPAAGADDLAYIIYTSGSTGTPKGAMIRHGNLLNYARWAADFYTRGEALAFPLFSSLSFDLTVTSLFVPLISGGSIVVYGAGAADGLVILDVMRDNLVDIVKLTPAHLALIREIDPSESRVRKMIVGGEDFKRSLAQSITDLFDGRIDLYNEYGPTEATVGCMIHHFDPATDTADSVPIGRPIDNAQVYILDDAFNPTPPGAVGEMVVGGAGVARGYLNRPELTAAKFVENPLRPGSMLYRTGDLARWTEDGRMQFLGRTDHQVKVNGYRVELGEIENNLLEHPAIAEAVVTVVEPQAASAVQATRACLECGIPDNHPGVTLDEAGVCSTCRDFDTLKDRFCSYWKTLDDLQVILDEARATRHGKYDCMVLYSGGKDSTYMLYQLVQELGMTPLVFSLDNGYISEEAKANMRRVTDDLGVDLVFGQTPHMNAVFVDSLKRHSNVCDGCFKVIYTLSMKLAREHGIRAIFTGLSRGQLFETRLSDMFHARIFDEAEIDRTVLAARKAYHRIDDAVKQLLDVAVFDDDRVFDEIRLVDFYRYTDVPLDEVYRYLDENAPWVRPSDTGRSTNCLINDVGIYIHKRERGYHNYALPYSWDVRVGHKTRAAAMDELDDEIDESRVREILDEIGYDESEGRRTQLAAYYVAQEPIDAAALRSHLSQRLPDYMLPAYFTPLEQMPLTRNGKVDRAALPQPEPGRIRVAAAFSPPVTPVEEQVAEIWRDLLNLQQVGVHDNFFELGGDSISTIQVMMRIAQAFSLELSPVMLFETPTVAGLADRIEAALVAEIEQLSDEEAELLLSALE